MRGCTIKMGGGGNFSAATSGMNILSFKSSKTVSKNLLKDSLLILNEMRRGEIEGHEASVFYNTCRDCLFLPYKKPIISIVSCPSRAFMRVKMVLLSHLSTKGG